ncbi:outer membrane beta-barrel protein [Venatoribacter cucullus]|nr:outer membrane beta-barrel protein [Venatoribacter cucullus]
MMKTLLAAAVVAASVPAMAATYQAGDIMVKAGAITVQPTNDATDIGASFVEISNNTQLGITGTYMFHSKWGVEVLAATPFEHNINLSSDLPVAALGATVPKGTNVASTKHLPPTVSMQFYPLGDQESSVQPYVGLGINYTTFFSEEGVANPTLKDSWGLAYSAGVNVHFSDNWMANVAVWKMDIDTKIEKSPVAEVVGQNVTIDPTVFLVGVGYKF